MSTSVTRRIADQDKGAHGGLPWTAHAESRTSLTTHKAKNAGMAVLLLAASAAVVRGETPDDGWPPFLAPRAAFSAAIVAAVERVWMTPTLIRKVHGRTARVPFELYTALMDSPEVTAAAARFHGLARYEVEALDDEWYRATDNDGARGLYRVLAREPTRRVVLSRGEHAGRLLGRIGGSALTVLDFPSVDGVVEPTVTARVRIDNAVAAALARVLIAVFGHIADRKLTEGFAVTARVAEWAVAEPDEFCDWLAQEPLPPGRSERVAAALDGCL
jgi:hypothetical protein